MFRELPYEITGASSLIGRVISIHEWAERMQIPDRHTEGVLAGEKVSELLGVHAKSWDPDRFRSPDSVTAVGRAALASAGLRPSEIDLLVCVTCTPYEIMLGQDAFRFSRELGLSDNVAPIQMEAGCGGLARVMNVVAATQASRVLVLSYNVASVLCELDGPNSNYRKNQTHPLRSILWASSGIFSDGIGAMVLERDDASDGFTFYSRDQQSFGERPGFADPIVHYPGGGLMKPPGYAGNDEMMAFAMSGRIIADYYNHGMLLNHRKLLEREPDYVESVERIYTHQAGPSMVKSFIDIAQIDPEKAPSNAAELGNLVSPCTLKLFHDDVMEETVREGHEVCFSVVGAGPERGAFRLRSSVRERVKSEDFLSLAA